MSERIEVELVRVSTEEIAAFWDMAEAYWLELMPHSPVIKDGEERKGYFARRFSWDHGNRHPLWGVCEGRRVGFVSFGVTPEKKAARVEDFFVSLTERRKGVGTAMVRALYAHLDTLGIELIELNVRRDNPEALRFWEAQGFRIALYQLRQYRDPTTGTGFIGGLSSDFV